MIQRHITIASHSGPPRTKRFVLGSLGIVLTVTATSGLAMAGVGGRNQQGYQPTADARPAGLAEDDSNNPTSDDDQPASAKPTDDSQPGADSTHGTASNSSTSSTTVSINGETIQVNGDGSYDRVYNSGNTSVNISVHNSSETKSSETKSGGDMD